MPIEYNILKKYLNPIFLETGSHAGAGIQSAIDAGFTKIVSIELSEKYFNFCRDRFKHHLSELTGRQPHVKLIQGDVELVLEDVIKDIKEPITFWLDAHYSGDDTALGLRGDPIYEELEIIKNHNIKTHTLLIDDVRGMNKELLEEKVKEINNNYQISYEDGYVPNDVLVAIIK